MKFNFILISLGLSFFTFISFLIIRFKKKSILIILAQLAVVLCLVLLTEIGGQIYATSRPAYKAIWMAPDPTLGWKFPPNFQYLHTGLHWYAREFSALIKTNSLGFRGSFGSTKKSPELTRIALLGDSMVSARQVDYKNTAGSLLQEKLNQKLYPVLDKKFEVLNFGIDAFGIGQSYLTYQKIARFYEPKYVFIFAFEYHIWRTISQIRCETNSLNKKICLDIRPAFGMDLNALMRLNHYFKAEKLRDLARKLKIWEIKKIEGFPYSLEEYKAFISQQKSMITDDLILNLSNALQREALLLNYPKDTEKLIELQNKVNIEKYGGNRVRKLERESFVISNLSFLFKELKNLVDKRSFLEKEREFLITKYAPENPFDINSQNKNFLKFEWTLFINLKVLEKLQRLVKQDGAKLVFVDATSNLKKNGELPSVLLSTIFEKFCDAHGISYLPLGDRLNFFNQQGVSTQWKYDGHLNLRGNQIFSDLMYEWIKKRSNLVSKS